MTKKNAVFRQGDIMLLRAANPPKDMCAVVRDPHGRVVLALGEGSGHAHALREAHVQAFRFDTSPLDEPDFITVGGRGASVRHEYASGEPAEHAPLTLPPGHYRVLRQREYSREGARRAAD